MALKDYYKELGKRSTPQKEFREMVAKACDVSEMTVYRWLSDDSTIIPEKLKREKIAEVTGLPVEDLFPNLNTDGNETE